MTRILHRLPGVKKFGLGRSVWRGSCWVEWGLLSLPARVGILLPMSSLTLELLGPPRLLSADGEALLTGGIPVALLAYLALEDRAVSRDHLAELFWPSMDRSRRLHNLRQTVLRIRNGHRENLLEGDTNLRLRPGALATDLTLFMDHVAKGQLSGAVALWKGPFLEGFRRSQSWELEDWIDRKRTMLEETLGTAVVGAARRGLDSGTPDEVLSLILTARQHLPLHEELGTLEVIALASVGRVPEAEGLFKSLELVEGSELEEEVRSILASPPPDPEEDSAPPAAEGARRFGHLSLLAAAVIILLLSFTFLGRGDSTRAAMVSSNEAGYAVLVCAGWATEGASTQLFRMAFDGTEKHRVSKLEGCEAVWVEESGALFAVTPFMGEEARLHRLVPNPDNPITEWSQTRVESASHLLDPRVSRGSPKVGAGGVFVFSAEDETGNRDIYGVEAGTGRLHRLTTDPGVDEWPTLAPNGKRVVFTSHRSGSGDLYSVGLDGTGLVRLTQDPLKDGLPWIRGDTVLFVRGVGSGGEDGDMDLFLLDLPSGTETRLTENGWNDFEPQWSPDGRHLCWQSERLGHYESDIMAMELATGRSWNVTETPGRESDCRWAPLSDGLLYLGWGEEEHSEVYLQSLRGGEAVNLSRYPGGEAVVGYFRLPEQMR
jgi:DNA-binding SARP family transcriptional activator